MSYFYNDITVKEEISISKLITKRFTRNKIEVSPFALYRINFKLDDNKIVLISGDDIIQTLTYEKFIEDYLYNEDYSLTKENTDFILNGSYYFTSVGLVTENDFFLAEDIQERYTKGIKKKDLEVNSIYFSNKGKEYLYLGGFQIKNIIKEDNKLIKNTILTEEYLYDLSKGEVVKKNSVKLVKFEKENRDSLDINLSGILYSNKQENTYYINIDTRIHRLTFYGNNDSNLFSLSKKYDNEYSEFTDSDDKILVLKEKEKIYQRDDYGKIIDEEISYTNDGRKIVRRRYSDSYGNIQDSVFYI